MDINQIAQLAGVSRATVSRYLNDGYVSQEKRAAIARVIKETGYVPSQYAKSLRTGKSNVVGVIIPKINSASVSRMVAGMTTILNEAGYQLLLANTDNDESREVSFLRLFGEKNQVDGIILIATVFTPAHEEVLSGLTLPLVVLNQSHPGKSCVYQNNEGALHDITELALKKGSHPAYIGVHEEDTSAGRMSHRGFLDACREAGVEVPDRAQVVTTSTVDTGYMAAEQILHDYPEVDTIVCATDSIAYGTLTCLQEYGHRVPEDIQVTGIGDGDLSQIVSPTLTTVHPYYKTSGIEAAKMLVGLMNDSDTAQRDIRMGYELVVRNSTR